MGLKFPNKLREDGGFSFEEKDYASDNHSNISGYGFDEYGFFKKPSDFSPDMPCDFWRDSTGKIHNNMDFDQYKTGTDIYVDADTGNNSTGDGSAGSPYRTITKAIAEAESGADEAYVIRVVNTSPFMKDEADLSAVTITKPISIVPETEGNRVMLTSGQKSLIWHKDGNAYYTLSLSGAYTVFDYEYKDEYGVYIPYLFVETYEECQAQPGTWYTDNSDVYVHRVDGAEPTDSNTNVGVDVGNSTANLDTDAVLYLENVDFYYGSSSDGLSIQGDTVTTEGKGVLVMNNCTGSSSNHRSDTLGDDNGDGLYVQDLKTVMLFDCAIGYTKRDCYAYKFFSVSSANSRDCFVLEVDCIGHQASWLSDEIGNNITTVHDGVSVMRINTFGSDAPRPLDDVDDCYTVCVDCEMNDATLTAGSFIFGSSGGDGKAILINCQTDDFTGLVSGVETFIYGFIGTIEDYGNNKIIK